MGFQFGSKKESSSSDQRVNVPSWLRPYIEQAAGTAGNTLQNLQGLTGRFGDLVAGFTPDQQAAMDLARQRAAGADGVLPTARDAYLAAARGGTPAGLGYSALGGIAGNQSVPQDVLGRIPGPSQLPSSVSGTLNNAMSAAPVPGVATDALTATARGDNLYGGPAFNEAVRAATDAARPAIQSAFGRAGPGQATGGLAQAAIGQSATDAFARQYLQNQQLQQSAANSLAGLGLQTQQQRIGSALGLGGLAGQNNALNANVAMQGASLLGGLHDSAAQRQLGAAGLLGNLENSAADRQLFAAGQLPNIANADINLLSGIGAQQQGLNQMRIDAPIQRQLQLLQAAYGFNPAFQSLYGQSGTSSGRSSGFNVSLEG